jgi:small GTP-binding protein
LIGDGYVGKTSIRRTYLKEGFKRSYIPTLGVDFAQKSIEFDGVPTNLIIWDIAGQPAYAGLRKRYYEGASGLILVYSVVDRTSFDNASKWLVEAHGFMKNIPPLVIAANKIDLSPTHPEEELVSPTEGKEFAEVFSKKLNTPVFFIETSALKGINIDEAFYELVNMMVGDVESKRSIPEKEEAPIQTTRKAATLGTAVSSETVTQEDSVSETVTTSAAEQSSETDIIMSSAAPEETTNGAESGTPQETEIDPVTSLEKDSAYFQDEDIAKETARLVDFRAELKTAEEELATTISELETKLLNLRNVVHVKKIMYEHLKKELETTRKEWAEAYNEYVNTDQLRKDELKERSREIEEIRKRIDEIGKIVRGRVSDLEMKRFSE